MVFSIALTGCSSDDNGATYTKSELETFLIRDSKDAIYYFEEEDLFFQFDFKKNGNGNIGEYFRENYNNGNRKKCEFIWDVEPSGDEGDVTMSFENGNIRLKSRMKLMEQKHTIVEVSPGEIKEKVEIIRLWKLDFKVKDDPFKGK